MLAERRRAVRAVAGRRELRHGADRGIRGRHAGRRVGHRGLPRRGRRTSVNGAARAARRTRPRSPRRCATWRWSPARRAALAAAAAEAAPRYAWPRVAARGARAPTRTRSRCTPRPAAERCRARRGLTPADGGRVPRAAGCRRSSRRSRAPPSDASRPGARMARRLAIGAVGLLRGGARGDRAAAHRSPTASATRSLNAAPPWVLRRPGPHVLLDGAARRRLARDPARRAAARAACGCATRCRARSSACSCPATLPARLGEPSRAFVVARRIGSPRDAPAGRARHDRLPDAAEHRRARSCSGS